ncbi:hypothetical protein [Rhizobium sp. NRK18]|uniref:hypothetical protein n=1 Tax=Rhizobium sp. NRK18 TaxID=2964667 RepID=UPI0021C43871|nr:hypothetical protein [Rhizobium sp. NRK18]MCQ2002368.1 hypothetical protein [Rhizobium sp. NRK18]
MRKPIRSISELHKRQHEIDVQFRNYRLSNLGRHSVSPQLATQLELRSAKNLNAANFISRIDFATDLNSHLKSTLKDSQIENLFFVTLANAEHSMAATEAANVDVKSMMTWISSTLAETNYVGMIEPAYYPKASCVPGGNRPWMSWHVHLLVWGIDLAEITKLQEQTNQKHMAFIPGTIVFHFRYITRKKVTGYVAYMCKSPVSEHNLYPFKEETVDMSTGEILTTVTGKWRQRKRAIRMSGLAKALTALEPQTIKSLCVANGEGKRIKKRAIRSARWSLRQQERSRDMELERAILG